MHSVYNVPIIPPNLQKEETIIQIAEVLNYLSEVTDDILIRINNRIELNNKQIKNITERINEANKKVHLLTGAKKATQIFSSSKYPASDINSCYISVFNNNEQLYIKRNKIKSKITQINDEPLDTLQFYHVKMRENIEKTNRVGLGETPRDVESVNDLLLYSTGKNPYKQYVMSDTLQVKQKLKEDDVFNGTDIVAAPLSITDRTALTKSTTETYFYSPDIGNVPAIDVPLDLPDLPGIADDLRYVNELGPGIAPSVTTTPNVPELPEIFEITNNNDKEHILKTDVVLPQPSPKIEEIEVQVPSSSNTVLSTTPAVKETVEELIIEEQPLDDKKPTSIKVTVNNDNARANLMDAIRKAGGSQNAKLRSSESQDTKKTSSSGGDLMADLHAKLAMRRKGISGTKNQNSDSTNYGNLSAMDRISAMIPPPPPINDLNESTNTEDEDWD